MQKPIWASVNYFQHVYKMKILGYGSYGKKKRDTGYYSGYNDYSGYYDKEECGTVEDCFDLPCPKYGIKVRYPFTRKTDGRNNGYDNLTERQTGEAFRTAAPPDCRTTG